MTFVSIRFLINASAINDSVGEWQYGYVVHLPCRFPRYLRLTPDRLNPLNKSGWPSEGKN